HLLLRRNSFCRHINKVIEDEAIVRYIPGPQNRNESRRRSSGCILLSIGHPSNLFRNLTDFDNQFLHPNNPSNSFRPSAISASSFSKRSRIICGGSYFTSSWTTSRYRLIERS